MPQWRWEDRINLDRMRKERVEKLCGEMIERRDRDLFMP